MTNVFVLMFALIVAMSSSKCECADFYWKDQNGKKCTSEMAYLPAYSHAVFFCKGSQDSSWMYHPFGKSQFENVKQDKHTAVHFDATENTWRLHLSRVRFESAGVYRCMSIAKKPMLIEVHILTVTNVSNALIELYYHNVFVGKFQIRIGAPRKNTNPTMVCVFKVKKPDWNRLSVRWRGGLYADMPQIYNTWNKIDEKNGLIQSGLTLMRPVLRRDVYGPYQCDLIIDGEVRLSGYVQLFIPPVLAQPRMDMYLSPGESLEYICEVIANPPLISPIKWARNKQLITVQSSGVSLVAGSREDNRISIDNTTWTNDRLKIVPLFDEDDATYSCFAQSVLDNATGAVNLRVKPKIITIIPIVGLIFELIGLVVCIYRNPRGKHRRKRKTAEFFT